MWNLIQFLIMARWSSPTPAGNGVDAERLPCWPDRLAAAFPRDGGRHPCGAAHGVDQISAAEPGDSRATTQPVRPGQLAETPMRGCSEGQLAHLAAGH
jgi:hypothetical protein